MRNKIIKTIIFLLQEHNSIDQITPLIEVLYQYHYRIKLIKTIHNYDYENDNNISYLKNKIPKLDIMNLFHDENELYSFLHNSYNYFNKKYSLQRNFITKILYYVLRGITRRIMVKLCKLNDDYLNKLFKNLNSSNSIIVSEITNGDYNYHLLLKKGYELKIKNISFTHGFDVLTNYLLGYHELALKDDTNLYNDATRYSDKMVVFNSLAIIRIGSHLNNKLIKLPSLRFTTQWQKKILLRTEKFKIKENYKLKIVFMLSAVNYNIWIEEQFRTIQAILNYKDIYLVVKVHPRDITIKNTFSKIKNVNFKVIGNEIPSSSLIDWADIVMSIGSGIIIESIIKNKISFYMKYLHCNKIELEDTKKLIYQIETRDEFVLLLEKYIKENNNDFIDQEERKEFLKDYIGNDDFDENAKQYITLFENYN